MNSLLYLILCGINNSLRETVRKPARLILYLFLIFIIVISLIGAATPRDPAEFKDIRLLGGMFFVLTSIFFIQCVRRAFKSGGSLFQMSDVNLLFVSPVMPQKILIYGVVRFLKSALTVGMFILFQGSVLGSMFRIGFLSLLLIIGIFALCVCLSEITAIFVYSVTNGNAARRLIAKTAAVFVFLPLVPAISAAFIRESDPAAALLYVCKSSAFQLIPVSGWGAAALSAFMEGQWVTGGLFIALSTVAIAGLLVLLLRLKSDYYEDVLVATESVFEKKRAISEGRADTAPAQKIRVAETGLYGFGAGAVFGKHLREILRKSRFGFIGLGTIIYAAAAAAAAVFINGDVSGRPILLILQYFAWLQIFSVANEPSLRELRAHYLYLLPEPPLNKLVWNSLAVVLKTGVDAVVVFGVAGVILKENPLIIAGVIFTAVVFALLLAGINIFGLRWTSTDLSTGILVIVYILTVIIAMLPGLIPAFIAAQFIQGDAGVLAALGIVCFWEIVASVLFFALSKGILNDCDLPVVKMPK